MTHLLRLLCPLALLLAAVPAPALTVSGAVTLAPPPGDVTLGAYESDTAIYLFPERTGVTLASDLAADVTAPGSVGTSADLTPGTIAAATAVDSYLLHFDPVGSTNVVRLTGSVTFDRPILGVLVADNTLAGSDGPLGHPGTLYPTTLALRGLEFPGQDYLTLSADMRTLELDWTASDVLDQVRVVTAVPEPT
ncbi:MAG: hypothetical protein D6739_02515, partial [Nitrospirae bacterium]